MDTDPHGQPHVISVSTATFVKVVLIVVGIWLVWFLRDVVSILLASLLLAALIDPFADWFEKRRIPRALAVLIVYAVLGLLTVLVSVLLVPIVIEQSVQLLANIGVSHEAVNTFLGNVGAFFQKGNTTIDALSHFSGLDSLSTVFTTITGFFGWIAALLIVLVLAFYMVIEEDAAKKYFKSFAPVEYRPFLGQLVNKMQKKIGAWLRGQLILGLIVGGAVYVGLSVLGVPYALLLAVIAGLLEIVPYLGPILSLLPAALVGFADSWLQGVFVIVLYLAIQQVENNLLVPKIMQKVTGLNPIVSIVALLVGIKIGGAIGAILSIPVATMTVVVLEELFANKTSA